jgi:hypothetical protein
VTPARLVVRSSRRQRSARSGVAPVPRLLLLPLLIANCTMASTAERGASATPTSEAPTLSTETSDVPAPPEIVVTRDNTSLPVGCDVLAVANFLNGFFDAFNRGDQDQLRAAVDTAAFKWYIVNEGTTTDGGTHFIGNETEPLIKYFADRHQHQERLQLVTVDVDGPAAWGNGVDIGHVVTRRADDLPAGREGYSRVADGKGAITCPNKKLIVWSMGMDLASAQSSIPLDHLCPDPAIGTPTPAVVACARR